MITSGTTPFPPIWILWFRDIFNLRVWFHLSIRPRHKAPSHQHWNLGKGFFIWQGFDFIVHPRSPCAVRLLLKYALCQFVDVQFFLIVLGPSLVLCAYMEVGRMPTNVIDHVCPLPENSTYNSASLADFIPDCEKLTRGQHKLRLPRGWHSHRKFLLEADPPATGVARRRGSPKPLSTGFVETSSACASSRGQNLSNPCRAGTRSSVVRRPWCHQSPTTLS